MNDVRREVMRAICDTVCPPLERADDPDGFWARSGSDVGAPEALAEAIAGLPPVQREGLEQLLDGLAQMGFLAASRRSREQLLRNLQALGPGRGRGRSGADDARAVPLLRAARPADRAQRLLGHVRIPRPERPAAAGAARADPARPRGGRGAARGGRRDRRHGRRRRRDRGRARAGGPARAAARHGRALRRVRLQPVRALGLPEPLLARRPQPDGRHERVALRRLELRRRHDDQLDQLPAHEALGARAVGARARASRGSTRRSSTATSTPSGSGSASTTAART